MLSFCTNVSSVFGVHGSSDVPRMCFPRILRFWRFFTSGNSSFKRTKATVFQSIKMTFGILFNLGGCFLSFHRLPSFGRVWNQGPRWQSRYISFSSAHSVTYCAASWAAARAGVTQCCQLRLRDLGPSSCNEDSHIHSKFFTKCFCYVSLNARGPENKIDA